MNKKTLIFLVLIISFCWINAQQTKPQQVGINTQNPGETIYIESEKLQTLLDVNGNLRIRDIPELDDRSVYIDENTNDINKVFASRLYWDYTQGTIEVPGISENALKRPFFLIEYHLNTWQQDHFTTLYKNLVILDFDTKIDASKFTAVIAESSLEQILLSYSQNNDLNYQGVYHIGFFKESMYRTDMQNANAFVYYDVPNGNSNANGDRLNFLKFFNPVEHLDIFVKNGTWHISGYIFQSTPTFQTKIGDNAYTWPYQYQVKVLAINNSYINRIRIPGNPELDPIQGIQTGSGENASIPLIKNPGWRVQRFINIHNNQLPYGRLEKNPLRDEWIIKSDTPRDDKNPFEF